MRNESPGYVSAYLIIGVVMVALMAMCSKTHAADALEFITLTDGSVYQGVYNEQARRLSYLVSGQRVSLDVQPWEIKNRRPLSDGEVNAVVDLQYKLASTAKLEPGSTMNEEQLRELNLKHYYEYEARRAAWLEDQRRAAAEWEAQETKRKTEEAEAARLAVAQQEQQEEERQRKLEDLQAEALRTQIEANKAAIDQANQPSGQTVLVPVAPQPRGYKTVITAAGVKRVPIW